GKLSCMWFQRSVDSFLGLPFNVASYALLTHIIAKMCDLEVGELIFSGGDTHIYKNHFDQVMEQLSRVPFDKPTIELPEFKSLDEVLTK
ncbi:thymidylate synthase, partial [Escherichia coli]